MTTLLQQELKGLTSSLDEDVDYSNAIDQAERDTGWSLPQTTAFKLTWLIARSKRHLFFSLLSESAADFRYKNIHLNHQFEHYAKLVEKMDKAFEKAQEDDAFEFAGVSAYEAMGTVVNAGFAYQGGTGKDYTYDEDNKVIITPNENS